MDILYRLSGRSQDEFFFHIHTRVWRPRSVTLRYSGHAAVIDRTTHAWLLITWLFSSSLLCCDVVVLGCVDLFVELSFIFVIYILLLKKSGCVVFFECSAPSCYRYLDGLIHCNGTVFFLNFTWNSLAPALGAPGLCRPCPRHCCAVEYDPKCFPFPCRPPTTTTRFWYPGQVVHPTCCS